MATVAATPGKGSSAFARVFLFCFGLPFIAGGLFGFYAMLQALEKPAPGLKDIALPAILGAVFTGAGVLLCLGGILGGRKLAAQEQRRAGLAGQPWLWREDWAAGRASGKTRKEQTFLWIFAIFWNLVSAPLLFILPEEISKKPVAAVGFLFPLVGAGLLTWAVRASMRAKRFGATYFEMSPLPASPGGRVSGAIRARFPVAPAQGVNLKLTCLRRTFSGSGEDRSSREDIVWRDERTLAAGDVMVAGGEAAIPVRFAVPAEALETSTVDDHKAGIFWVVTADARLEGIDYQDDFEIPVYGAGAAPAAEPAEAAQQEAPIFASDRAAAPAAVTPSELARAGITIAPTAEGTAYRFAPGRNKSFALGLAGFAAIWTGSIALMLHLGAPWFFVAVFTLFDLLFVYLLVDLLFGSTTLTIGGGELIRKHTALGLGERRRIPFENIQSLDLHINMQTSGRRGTPYYAVRATLRNGRHRVLADGMREKSHAEWLAGELRRAAGIK